ncbi:MAG TPA: Fe-S cluster assembly protein SufB, partial [Thermoplasmata archaeon]
MVSKSVLQEQMAKQEYKYGFVSDLDEDKAPKGLNEDIVRLISRKKNEPEWFLEWRLR